MDSNNNKAEDKISNKGNYQKLTFEDFETSKVAASFESNDTDEDDIWNASDSNNSNNEVALIESPVSKRD